MPKLIGTAGHIDHGKTALVRALTGIDTDRLKEEKERGISIDLGFAYLDMSGERVAVIDVPGHERFIKNMLAGAHGVDLALLVVAADDGVMPQTEEHLEILHWLGVREAAIAITKSDLVDARRIAEVEEEIAVLTEGTHFEGSPTIAVSVVTGDGIESLRDLIATRLARVEPHSPRGFFRLPIDRVFTLHGHGTVVTGTALSGRVQVGDMVRIMPRGEEVRVRSIHNHDVAVASGGAGQRLALNLNVERVQLTRGDLLCDPHLDRATDCVDAWVELRGAKLKSHQLVRLHVGTAQTIAKAIPLSPPVDSSDKTSTRYLQLVLRDPIAVVQGDHFVLRHENASGTIGGGIVVHPFAPRRRGRAKPAVALPNFGAQQGERSPDVANLRILLQLESSPAVSVEWLSRATGMTASELTDKLRAIPEIVVLPDADDPAACLLVERWQALRSQLIDWLRQVHQQKPGEAGVELEPLHRQLVPALSSKLFQLMIDAWLGSGEIARTGPHLHLPQHRPQTAAPSDPRSQRLVEVIAQAGLTPPDLQQLAASIGLGRPELTNLLRQLERAQRIVKVAEGLYFEAEVVAAARQRLQAHLEHNATISAAQLRDLFAISRKYSIALLDYFDRTGFTMRVGDIRKLRR